jgi:antitoxin (DNA-binding transcriptional repressor) of toxin-antitoxin stability system
MEVSIREMKNSLSRYLKLVQAGRDVTITDRGRPVARLTLMPDAGRAATADAIERIKSLPWVKPGTGRKVRGLRLGIELRGSGESAAALVLQDRN